MTCWRWRMDEQTQLRLEAWDRAERRLAAIREGFLHRDAARRAADERKYDDAPRTTEQAPPTA